MSDKERDRINTAIVFTVIVLLIILFDMISDWKEQSDRMIVAEKIILDSPAANPTGFVIQDQVDTVRLQRFAELSYADLKQELGIESDFAVTLRDQDGSVIPVEGKVCIGSSKAKIGDIPCG